MIKFCKSEQFEKSQPKHTARCVPLTWRASCNSTHIDCAVSQEVAVILNPMSPWTASAGDYWSYEMSFLLEDCLCFYIQYFTVSQNRQPSLKITTSLCSTRWNCWCPSSLGVSTLGLVNQFNLRDLLVCYLLCLRRFVSRPHFSQWCTPIRCAQASFHTDDEVDR